MQKINQLFEFTIFEKVEKDKSESSIVDGKEVVTTTKEQVDSPVKIIFAKPSRREEEDGELFYAKKMNEFVNKHNLMTRAMLVNKYKDSGGLISEESVKELVKLHQRLIELREEIALLEATSKKTKKQAQKIENLKAEFIEIQQQIVDLDSYKHSLLEQTADSKAQNELLRWYALKFSFIQREDEDIVPYFAGETFDQKLEDYFVKEDVMDELYKQAGAKIGTCAAVWFFHRESDKEKFKQLVERAEQP